MQELERRRVSQASKTWCDQYADDPEGFFRDVLRVERITDQQAGLLRDLARAVREEGPPFLVVPAGHAVGKSYLLARIAIWAAHTMPRTCVITTAGTESQVKNVLWKEIRQAWIAAGLPPGRCNIMGFEVPEIGSFAVGVTTNDPGNLAGFHAPRILIIIDEGPQVPAANWLTITEGLANTDGAIIIAVGNPVTATGPFRDKCSAGGRWLKRQLSCLEHPNVINKRTVIPAGPSYAHIKETILRECEAITDRRVIAELDEARRALFRSRSRRPANRNACMAGDRLWFEGTYFVPNALVQSRILGEFPDEGEDTLIPLSHIVRAMERGRDRHEAGAANQDVRERFRLAMDIAWHGGDRSVVAIRRGRLVWPLRVYQRLDIAGNTTILGEAIREFEAEYAAVDEGTFGAAVVEKGFELGYPIVPVVFGGMPAEDMRQRSYYNKRAQMYWNLRCLLEVDAIDLPYDEDLMGELADMRYTISETPGHYGHILIESKREMRKRGARSPDMADALAMLCDDTLMPGRVDDVDLRHYTVASAAGRW